MAKTPISASSSYCTPTQMLQWVDIRVLQDVLADDDVPVPKLAVLTHTNLVAALNSASGEVESECLKGGRYKPEDLLALTGVSATALQRMVAILALGNLHERRYPDKDTMPAVQKQMDKLTQLASGEAIFGLVEVQQAGLPDTDFMTVPQIEFNGLTTSLSGRYFGRRANIERWGRTGHGEG